MNCLCFIADTGNRPDSGPAEQQRNASPRPNPLKLWDIVPYKLNRHKINIVRADISRVPHFHKGAHRAAQHLGRSGVRDPPSKQGFRWTRAFHFSGLNGYACGGLFGFSGAVDMPHDGEIKAGRLRSNETEARARPGDRMKARDQGGIICRCYAFNIFSAAICASCTQPPMPMPR